MTSQGNICSWVSITYNSTLCWMNKNTSEYMRSLLLMNPSINLSCRRESTTLPLHIDSQVIVQHTACIHNSEQTPSVIPFPSPVPTNEAHSKNVVI